jgi:hypothetical protein
MVRPSTFYLSALIVCGAMLFVMLAIHPSLDAARSERGLEEKQEWVRALGLTDLCLFTEARYTRHPSQADLHSAFQDHPMSFEHFPSGSLTLPKERRKADGGRGKEEGSE